MNLMNLMNNNMKDMMNKSCKELSKITKGKEYLYWVRCRKCQNFRKCKYI